MIKSIIILAILLGASGCTVRVGASSPCESQRVVHHRTTRVVARETTPRRRDARSAADRRYARDQKLAAELRRAELFNRALRLQVERERLERERRENRRERNRRGLR